MTYYGTITDAANESQPIPGATVTLYTGGAATQRVAADRGGYFSVNSVYPADEIEITSAGYKPMRWPASTYQHRFELERNEITLPPVVINPRPLPAPGPKFPVKWALIALAVLFIANRK